MTTRVGANAEAIAVSILLANADVVAVFATRIGTELDLSKASSLPALRVSTVSTRPLVRRHLDGTSVQLESWATTRLEAKRNLELARGALLEDGLEGRYQAGSPAQELGTLTGIDNGTGPVPRPDPETDTPRWLCTMVLYTYPTPMP
jgi:hypothetical protein